MPTTTKATGRADVTCTAPDLTVNLRCLKNNLDANGLPNWGSASAFMASAADAAADSYALYKLEQFTQSKIPTPAVNNPTDNDMFEIVDAIAGGTCVPGALTTAEQEAYNNQMRDMVEAVARIKNKKK